MGLLDEGGDRVNRDGQLTLRSYEATTDQRLCQLLNMNVGQFRM